MGVSKKNESFQDWFQYAEMWAGRALRYLIITSFTACSLNSSLMRLRIFSF